MIKIGLAQVNFLVGDIEGNAKKILSSVAAARKKGVGVLVFPELALVGYPPQDLLLKKYFITKNIDALNRIKKHTKGIVAIVGFVDRDDHGALYNAYALVQNGQILDVYHKINLPNYGVFDEKRYFKQGKTLSTYSFGGYSFSVTICEDIWRKDFVALLANKRLDFIINVSASPFQLGKLSLRKDIFSYTAKTTGSSLFYCNLIGGQDDLIFDGTSMVVSKEGTVCASAERFKEDMLIVRYPLKKAKSPAYKEIPEQAAFDALCLGIKDYVAKHRFKKVIIGVSGGIDSAVVASLSALSLGKQNVHGLIMPSRYTSRATFNDAVSVCKNLGIAHSVVSIDAVFDQYLDSLKTHFKKRSPDKTEENIQARIRGNILMAFSNKFDYLVFNTGNKSELSCGYCTLYGDMVGGFGILSDIPKTLVYRLARHINTRTKRNIIPTSVIKRAPSAELAYKQKDSDALPVYSVLDPILKMYIEDDLSLEEIVASGVKRDLARKVIRMVDSNEYKRRQAPLGIKISSKAFGRDRRMPITNKFSG